MECNAIFSLDNTSGQYVPSCNLQNQDENWCFMLLYSIYFSLIFLVIIYVFITRHVKKSRKHINSTDNFKKSYRKLSRNISQTVFHKSVKLILYLIAAICNRIDGIDERLRLTFILSTMFIVSSLHPVNYFIQEWCKHRKRTKMKIMYFRIGI